MPLLASALSLGAPALAPPAITRLYQVTFDPLSLCAEIAPVLHELKAEEDYALYCLLSQLAQVYASVRIDFVMELIKLLRELAAEVAAAPVAEGEEKLETETVESYIIGCTRRGELAVRVDHAAAGPAGNEDLRLSRSVHAKEEHVSAWHASVARGWGAFSRTTTKRRGGGRSGGGR
ncbi:hypothetical protein B0H11DRAFT_2239944 [Mycena galericulata]|nr:hypothetical protein B0H11DRAFT_2239944 [Mycena galericulata]